MQTEETIKQREKQLFDLGFARYLLGFTTLGIFVSDSDIRTMHDIDWENHFKTVQLEITQLRKDADPSSKPPIPKSDTEKLQDFVRSLGQITGPEVQDPKILHILDCALVQIRETREFINLSIRTM